MDPTNQPPGQPTPPWGPPAEPTPWGTAPEPGAPQPGQPTPPWAAPGEPTPPWAAPGQPGAPQPGYPQPGYPQPGFPPPGVPGQPWPQAPQKSGGKRRRIALAAVAALVVIVAIVAFNVLKGSNDGKVLFSTDVPTSAQKCNPTNVVTTISAKTSVYATYEYTGRMGSDQVTLNISKDGTAYGVPVTFAVTDTSGTDCGYDPTDWSGEPGWGAGTWKFTLTAAGKTVSEGSLVVTP